MFNTTIFTSDSYTAIFHDNIAITNPLLTGFTPIR